MGKQTQRYTKEPVYPTVFSHVFSSNIAAIPVNTGAFPAAGDLIPLSAAQSSKALQPGGLGVAEGDIALSDAADQILLEPGVYEVRAELRFTDGGVNSDFSCALTNAAAAAVDVEDENVNGTVLSTAFVAQWNKTRILTVTAARALELHCAATTATGQVTLLAGSAIHVRRLGNVE